MIVMSLLPILSSCTGVLWVGLFFFCKGTEKFGLVQVFRPKNEKIKDSPKRRGIPGHKGTNATKGGAAS